MIQLETSEGTVLSKQLRDISPIGYTSSRQVNRLLDGSYHVQIIGSPLKTLEGTIVASYNQAGVINNLADQGTLLVLTFLEKQYLVYIDKKIAWTRINFANGNLDRSLYEGKVLMIIKEEVLA